MTFIRRNPIRAAPSSRQDEGAQYPPPNATRAARGGGSYTNGQSRPPEDASLGKLHSIRRPHHPWVLGSFGEGHKQFGGELLKLFQSDMFFRSAQPLYLSDANIRAIAVPKCKYLFHELFELPAISGIQKLKSFTREASVILDNPPGRTERERTVNLPLPCPGSV